MKKIKFCTKCKTIKPLVKFYKNKSKNNDLVIWCKECCRDYGKIYYKIHKDHCKIISKIYHKTNKNYYKIYRKTHRDLWNFAFVKYMISKDQRTPFWANLEMIQKFYTKAMKLTKKTGIQYDVDHIIPLHGKNVSGLHVENNLQIITHIKNCQKGNSWIL